MRQKRSRIRVIIAAALLLFGVSGSVFWEAYGREHITYTAALVAAKDIKKGEIVTGPMLAERAFAAETLVRGSVAPDRAGAVLGHVARHDIPANAQISDSYVYQDDFYIGEGESLFTVPSEWIDGFSSTVRRGDDVEFWLAGAAAKIGEWKVAFVKARDGVTEVTNLDGRLYTDEIEREFTSAQIGHIEIICDIEDYKRLYRIATGEILLAGETGPEDLKTDIRQKFLIVQKVRGE